MFLWQEMLTEANDIASTESNKYAQQLSTTTLYGSLLSHIIYNGTTSNVSI